MHTKRDRSCTCACVLLAEHVVHAFSKELSMKEDVMYFIILISVLRLFAARKWHARAYSNTLTHARTNRTHLSHAIGAGEIILDFNRHLHAIS